MYIEKLKSGKYRARMYINGKKESAYFENRPTESEALLAFSKKTETMLVCEHITFEVAANEYCKLKENVLSPTTYREYKNIPDRLSKSFLTLFIDEISTLQIQHEINTLAKDKKPKTVKNYYNFIVSVIRMYNEDFKCNVKLPDGEKKEPYIPTDDEVKLLLDTAKDSDMYIPLILACYGMRRSEICALTPSDIKGNIVHIQRAKVQNADKEWIIKNYPKNETSVRNIPIPQEIVDIINEQGYVYNGHPNSISKFIERFCKKNNIEHFSIHKLRHYFCSRLSAENIDVETIISLSGHKTDYVMRTVYRHVVNQKVQDATKKLDEILLVRPQ